MIYSIETNENVFFLPHKPTLYKGNITLGIPVYAPTVYELPIKSLCTDTSEEFEETYTVIILSKFAREVKIPESKIEFIAECNKDDNGNDCIDGVPIFPTIEHYYDWFATHRPTVVERWLDEVTHGKSIFFSNLFGVFNLFDDKYYDEHVADILNYLYAIPDDI